VSLAVLGLVCSALAFSVFFRLIGEVGPSRATVVTYVNPVVALLWARPSSASS
jgi:drug/metabolite transporter (DMT)-like permease